jgi:hypothetical protein
MKKPATHPAKTLQIEKSLPEVADAILFIPALSSTYKLAKANLASQLYTFSAAANSNVYVDIGYRFVSELTTSVRVEVRRKKGTFEKDTDMSLANQHLSTVLNLLSDSLALEPGKKARLVSERSNERTSTAYGQSETKSKSLNKKGNEQPQNAPGKVVWYIVFILLAAILYGLYKYFKQ